MELGYKNTQLLIQSGIFWFLTLYLLISRIYVFILFYIYSCMITEVVVLV